jgi:hypothetical protein
VVADDLICGEEQCVYADKAYDSAARRQLLARLVHRRRHHAAGLVGHGAGA